MGAAYAVLTPHRGAAIAFPRSKPPLTSTTVCRIFEVLLRGTFVRGGLTKHAPRRPARALASPKAGLRVALVINGEHISDRMLDRELLRLSSGLEMDAPQAGAIDPAQLRAAAMHNVIDRTLLLQMARNRQLAVSASEVQAELVRRWGVERSSACDPGSVDVLREELLIERVRAELTRHVPRPGRAAVEQFYRANLHHYREPEAVEAAHILCGFTSDGDEDSALQMIKEANDKLQGGTPFPRVADAYSDCKGVGGSVGWISRGMMVPEFEDAVFSLAPNGISPIFRTVFGFHIATVKRRRNEGVVPLEQIRLALSKRMHHEARAQLLHRTLVRLRAESDIHHEESPSHG